MKSDQGFCSLLWCMKTFTDTFTNNLVYEAFSSYYCQKFGAFKQQKQLPFTKPLLNITMK